MTIRMLAAGAIVCLAAPSFGQDTTTTTTAPAQVSPQTAPAQVPRSAPAQTAPAPAPPAQTTAPGQAAPAATAPAQTAPAQSPAAPAQQPSSTATAPAPATAAPAPSSTASQQVVAPPAAQPPATATQSAPQVTPSTTATSPSGASTAQVSPPPATTYPQTSTVTTEEARRSPLRIVLTDMMWGAGAGALVGLGVGLIDQEDYSRKVLIGAGFGLIAGGLFGGYHAYSETTGKGPMARANARDGLGTLARDRQLQRPMTQVAALTWRY
jgi:hypothetical protein